MADQKISQLPTITGANMADNDKFVLVDTSGNATVATTRAEFFKSVPDVTFGDNDKAIFGAGSDLQIYHDGSDSYITDTTGGNFFINDDGAGYLMMKGSDLYFRNASNADMIHAQSGGFVKLYHNGSPKLTTTSIGINVTGTVNSDGLTVDGDSVILGGSDITNTGATLQLESTETAGVGTGASISFKGDDGTGNARTYGIIKGSKTTASTDFAGGLDFFTRLNAQANATKRMSIDSSGNVGIGTDSPNLHGWTTAVTLNTSHNGGYEIGQSGTKYGAFALQSDGRVQLTNFTANALTFQTNNTERMRITSTGQVGIGTTSPSGVAGTIFELSRTGSTRMNISASDSSYSAIDFSDTTADGQGRIEYYHIIDAMRLYTAGSERMRIDSSGRVGIGTSSPSANLHVSSTGDTIARITSADGNGAFLDLGDASDPDGGRIVYDSGSNLGFSTASTERMRITSTGQVGIGTSSPSGVAGTIFELSRTGSTRMNISAGDSSYSAIDFSDTTADGQGRIEYYHIIDAMRLYTAGSERIRIDSSGNVGIGIAAPDTILHGAKNGGATLTLENTDTTIGANNLIGGIDFKGNDDSEDGNEVLAYIRAKALDATPDAYLSFGTLGNAGGVDDTVTERMRIASSGNVGISQTGPTALLHVGDSSNSLGGTAGNSLSNLILQSDTSNTDSLIFTTERNSTGTTWTSAAHKIQRKVDAIEMGYMQFGNNTTDLITFGKADTEFVRIDSSGNVSIGKNNVLISAVGVHFTTEGTVSATKDGSIPLVLNRVATGTNNPNGVIAQFRRETVIVGNISVSDGATAYNTSSDYRLKENVVELTSASERVNQLKPSRFNWISDDTNTVIDGFIAHEVATVVPEAITGAKDAMIDEEYEVTPEVLDEDGNVTTEAVVGTRSVPDYQGIDQSKLVPLLTAALQEALTEISSLKSRVEALEG